MQALFLLTVGCGGRYVYFVGLRFYI